MQPRRNRSLRLAAAIESTPDDALVQLRVAGAMPATLTTATLRAITRGTHVAASLVPADDLREGR
jgi:hypothetical protein